MRCSLPMGASFLTTGSCLRRAPGHGDFPGCRAAAHTALNGWQPMNFERTPLELELEVAVQRFVRDTVVPYEQDPRIDSRGRADELRRELQQAARARALLAPQLSLKHGGRGLDHRHTATLV